MDTDRMSRTDTVGYTSLLEPRMAITDRKLFWEPELHVIGKA